MSVTNKLTPEAEEQRARLEEQLPPAAFDEDENGNRQYKNLGAHVLPLLRILGLQGWEYTLWRFSNGVIIQNETGLVYLIAIRTVSGTRQIEPEVR